MIQTKIKLQKEIKMKLASFVILFFFLASCSQYDVDPKIQFLDSGPGTDIANQIQISIDEQLEKSGFHIAFRKRNFPENIDQIEIGYYTTKHKITSIEEARLLFVKFIENFLDAYNNSNEVRPYLENYPFKPENLNIVIFFLKNKGQKIPDAGCVCEFGKFAYFINDPTGKNPILHEETFSRAKSIYDSIMAKRTDVNLNNQSNMQALAE